MQRAKSSLEDGHKDEGAHIKIIKKKTKQKNPQKKKKKERKKREGRRNVAHLTHDEN